MMEEATFAIDNIRIAVEEGRPLVGGHFDDSGDGVGGGEEVASIEEADAMMRQLKATGVFKEISIVRDQITIEIN